MSKIDDYKGAMEAVAEIIRDSGGRIVGRTKLQKVACLLELAGVGNGFAFRYKHYGPYSEQVAWAAQLGGMFGRLSEEERPATWGGRYSVYSVPEPPPPPASSPRRQLAKLAADSDSVELELAVTAAFLARDEIDDPWARTELLKPEKCRNGGLSRAKRLYRQFLKIDGLPVRLPQIA